MALVHKIWDAHFMWLIEFFRRISIHDQKVLRHGTGEKGSCASGMVKNQVFHTSETCVFYGQDLLLLHLLLFGTFILFYYYFC